MIKFYNLNISKKLIIIQIILQLLLAKIIVKLIPLKFYYNKMFSTNGNYKVGLQKYYNQFLLFKKITNLIPMRITCLEESIALKLYFNKLKVDLPIYLGINTDAEDRILAHAWSIFEDSQIANYKKINYEKN